MRRLAKKVLAFFILCVSFYGCWVEKGKRPFDDVQSKADSGDFYYGGYEYDDDVDNNDAQSERVIFIDGGYAKVVKCENNSGINEKYFPVRISLLNANTLVLLYTTKRWEDKDEPWGGLFFDYALQTIDLMSGLSQIYTSIKLTKNEGCVYYLNHKEWFAISCFKYFNNNFIIFRPGEWGQPWDYEKELSRFGNYEKIVFRSIAGDKIIFEADESGKGRFYIIYDTQTEEKIQKKVLSDIVFKERYYLPFFRWGSLLYDKEKEVYFNVAYKKDNANFKYFIQNFNSHDLALSTREELALTTPEEPPLYGFISFDNRLIGLYDKVNSLVKIEDTKTGDIFEKELPCKWTGESFPAISNGVYLQMYSKCNDDFVNSVYDMNGSLIDADYPYRWHFVDEEKSISLNLADRRLLIHRFDWGWNEFHALNYYCGF